MPIIGLTSWQFWILVVSVFVVLYCCSMEEMHIYDIDFLYGCSQPTIVLLHEDVHGRHVKTHEISLKDRDLVKVCYLGSVLELNKGWIW